MAERTSALTAGGHKSICVYDGQLNLLARLESWVSLVWPARYNVYSGVQGAQLELHASTDLQALCRPDRYLWLTGSDRIMRICSAQTDRSEHKLVISARDAACILDERISTQTLSGFAVESTLRSLVSGVAAWPGLELGVLADLADTYTGEVKPGSLLSIAEQVCQELDIGFRVRFDQQAKKLLFELYRPKLDPNARWELYLDATSKKKKDGQSQEEYLAALRALGEQELAKHTRIENFRFTPTGSVTVGKVVAASLPGTDIQAAARITSVTLSSQKGENTVTTEIGTPILRRKQ